MTASCPAKLALACHRHAGLVLLQIKCRDQKMALERRIGPGSLARLGPYPRNQTRAPGGRGMQVHTTTSNAESGCDVEASV